MARFLCRIRLRWILAGGAFIGAVMSTGCSSLFHSNARQAKTNEQLPWHKSADTDMSNETSLTLTPDRDFAPIPVPQAKPQRVNVFGEIDGVRPGQVMATGEAGFQEHTFLDEGYDSDVALDPTGKWMVFASTRHSQHPDIYLQRVDGTSVTQLTSDDCDDAYPSFSPDGKQIAFCSTRGGNWQIYLMDNDGRNVTQVTSGPMQAVHPSFSPDGTRVVYAALGSRSNQWELWVANLASNEKRMIGYGLFPVWSPARDTDRIAFQRTRQRGSRWFSLWTLDLMNGEGRRVTEVSVSGNAAIVCPSWSPDGKRLAFATILEPAKAGARSGGRQDVWTVDADGSNRQRLTDGNGSNLMPCWASDNRVYFVSDRGGKECIWSVQAEAARTFTADAAPDKHTPAAQPGKTPPGELMGDVDLREIRP